MADFPLDFIAIAEERDRLRQELSLAEEGLANYAQEVKELRDALDRVRDADSVEESFRIAVEALWSPGHPRAEPAASQDRK